MRRSVLCTLLTYLLGSCFCLAATPGYTLEQIMSAPFASSLVAAPAQPQVAWLINEHGQRNIWVAGAPEWKGKKITHFDNDDGQEIAEISWTSDGKHLLFARGGDFEMGRGNPNPGAMLTKPDQSIWIVPFDASSAPRKLTEGHAAAVVGNGFVFVRAGQLWISDFEGKNVRNLLQQQGTVNDLRPSPDGKAVAFTSERGNHNFIGLFDIERQSIRYLGPSTDEDGEAVWSPNGKRLAWLRLVSVTRALSFGPVRSGEPWSIHVFDLASGKDTTVFTASEGDGSVFHPIVARSQLLWTANDRLIFPYERTGWCHLYSVAANGGSAVELTPGEGEVEHVTLSSDRKSVLYSTNIGDIDRRHLRSLNLTGKERPKELTSGEEIEWEPASLPEGDIAYLASNTNEKSHAVIQKAGAKAQALAPETLPADYPKDALVKPQAVTITAADGMQIHGQLFLPSGSTSGEKHPALVFFHGGSRRQMLLGFHYMYYYSNAYAMNQYLASQGYVVLSVNYRSGIGYGLNFREALHYGATGASEFNDVIGAGLYLKSRADVDGRRIGLWGGSYGGYLTALGLARASDLFAAGVDFHGVHDWNEVIRNFTPSYDPSARAEVAKVAFESSPMASVGSWRSAVLLIHGDDDRNVPFSQTVQLAEALRKQHVYFEEMIIPNEIHDFLMHEHWVKAYTATAEFFRKQLTNASTLR